jgi:dihydroxyacetone kinase-like protein
MVAGYLSNGAERFVADGLAGLAETFADIVRWNPDPSFIVRASLTDKVGLVSGGGSGHEPLHTGFVGRGMLDAAVPGEIFASPAAFQVAAATSAVDAGRGVLHIVKNYTGDLINFRFAAEQVASAGVEVASVIVDDDLAEAAGGEHRETGRRGTAAVVAVEKICGAAAEAGVALEDVARLGRRVVASSGSLAAAWGPVVHPATGQPSFTLEPGEMEFGVGIHGERGEKRLPMGSTADVVDSLAKPILSGLGLKAGDRVLAIVNGLGGVHPLELFAAGQALRLLLQGQRIDMTRSLVGSYVTSLNMAGMSLTLVRLDEDLLRLWDAPVSTPALRW